MARTREGKLGLGGLVLLAVLCHGAALSGLAAEPACPSAPRIRLELPVTQAAVAHDQPVTVVALGSSSTEGTGASAPDRTYPARLEALLQATWPDAEVTVLNRGVGGQTIDAVLTRLDTDVVAAQPTLVIWQVGTNEALRHMDPERFEALLNAGLDRLATLRTDVVLMDYQLAPRMPPEASNEVYGAVIARQARLHSVRLFSRVALMRAWEISAPNEHDMIGPDGLHHSDHGYACLAWALDTAIAAGAAPRVAAVVSKGK